MDNQILGIGLFGLQLIRLIALDRKESFQTVEDHRFNGDLVEYLYNKYKTDFYISFDNSVYDNLAINNYFSQYNGYINGNESRKYGVENDNGLLLLVALLMDRLELSN